MIKPKTRLFMEGVLDAGAEIALGKNHVHFLGNVLRLRSGDKISLFNGDCGEWSATVENLLKRHGVARIGEQVRCPQPEPGPWLAFAPVKKTRTDFIVEKATELGVEKLIPIFTRFTATARVNCERLRAISIEAAEQCERLSVPEVSEPCSLMDLLADWPSGRKLFIGDEKGGGVSLAQALSGIEAVPEHGFLIGPEGGFADDELALVTARDFCQSVDLGPRILRAETAAIAALSVWNALTERSNRLSQH